MPNVTITVPDELKAEMDKLAEVSWSEICRNAISRYIDERRYPAPKIELDISDARLDLYGWQSGYPELTFNIKIHNKMDSEIILDRILFNIKFIDEGGYQYTIGSGHDLSKRYIPANSSGGGQGYVGMSREKIEALATKFKSTFYCSINFTVFADGFKNGFNQEIRIRIPIDDWKDLVEKTMKRVES